jgi:hypothetical protein
MNKFYSVIGAVVIWLGLLVGAIVLNAWVVSVLWKWFMVPIFHLPVLTIPMAIGTVLVINYLIKETKPVSKKCFFQRFI